MNINFIKGKSFLAIFLAAALMFAVLNVWMTFLPLAQSEGEGGTVDITATVAPSVTCDTDVTATGFGPLSTGSVTTATPNASTTLSCNTGLGCTLSVSDVGDGATNPGLATTTPAYLIPSPNAAYDPTAVLAINTEGYGITATTTTGGSGGSLTIYSRYDHDSGGTTVGGLKRSGFGVASSSGAISNRQLTIKHKAAISGATQAGKYEDTLTYSCTGN